MYNSITLGPNTRHMVVEVLSCGERDIFCSSINRSMKLGFQLLLFKNLGSDEGEEIFHIWAGVRHDHNTAKD